MERDGDPSIVKSKKQYGIMRFWSPNAYSGSEHN